MGSKILMHTGVSPKKSLGQNFFINKNLLNHIVELTIKKRSTTDMRIIEIGPGTGSFTRKFLDHGFQVLTIEKDRTLAYQLTSNNIKTINEDFLLLKKDVVELINTFSDTIFGSLPYNRSKNIIFTVAQKYQMIKYLFVIIQKEVAEKFAKEDNKLGIKIRAYFTPKILIRKINPSNFSPKPKVNSSFIQFTRTSETNITDLQNFGKYVDTIFKQPKKTIRNNLKSSTYNISQIPDNILSKRPSQLTYEQHTTLYEKLINADTP